MLPSIFHALRPDSVSVTLLGRFWDLETATAQDWIGAIGADPDRLTGIMPGMLHEQHLDEMLKLSLNSPDIEQRWLRCAQAALTRGSGRDWWWSYNLTLKCLPSWSYINGMLLHRGVQARQLPYPDWLDAAYMLLWERGDEQGRAMLDAELGLPPKNMEITGGSRAGKKMLAAFAAD